MQLYLGPLPKAGEGFSAPLRSPAGNDLPASTTQPGPSTTSPPLLPHTLPACCSLSLSGTVLPEGLRICFPSAGNPVPQRLMGRSPTSFKGPSTMSTHCQTPSPFSTFLLLLFSITLVLYTLFMTVYYLLSVYTYSDVSPMRSGIFVLSLIHPACLGQCLTSGEHSINIFLNQKLLT